MNGILEIPAFRGSDWNDNADLLEADLPGCNLSCLPGNKNSTLPPTRVALLRDTTGSQ